MTPDRHRAVLIVSSSGGHLTEVMMLRESFLDHEHHFVLNHPIELPAELVGRTDFIAHSERDWKFLLNLWQAYMILRRVRPRVILSTGAGPLVPVAIISRLFFRSHIIFVESITRVTDLSMTGKIMRFLADEFYVQWPALADRYAFARYVGGLV